MIGTLSVPDINHALMQALPLLLTCGQRHTAASLANQRPTVEWPGVFITEYTHPSRCVLFDEKRDANPMFHYLEAMWILAGRNDTKFLAHVLPKMAEYSDDGTIFHGAYGYRLREAFGKDQVDWAIEMLRAAPASRQVVMSIWDPVQDLGAKTKDMPCNDMIMCKVREGRLYITVNNRSNDVIYGCYGANVVQFSMLLMYMAARIGVGLGTYTQVSNSFHVYDDSPYWQDFIEGYHSPNKQDYYQYIEKHKNLYRQLGDANLFALRPELVDSELVDFFDHAIMQINDPDEEPVMSPDRYQTTAVHDAVCIWNALHQMRDKDYKGALKTIDAMQSSDWRCGCDMWLKRRYENHKRKVSHAV
jgi:hypothetical protein